MVKKVFLLLAISALFITVSYAEDLYSSKAEDYYVQAMKLQRDKKDTEAKTDYQKAVLLGIKNDKHKKIACNNLAVIYAGEKNFVKAEELLKQALAIDPNYQTARLNLGLVYEQSKSPQQAKDYWIEILGLERLSHKEFIRYSDIDNNFLKDCKTDLCRKVVLNNEAVDFAEKWDLDKAEELLNAALAIDPECDIAGLNVELIHQIKETSPDNRNSDYLDNALEVSLDAVRPKEFIIDK